VFCRGAACLRPCPDLRDLNVFEANTVPAFPAPERRSPVQRARGANPRTGHDMSVDLGCLLGVPKEARNRILRINRNRWNLPPALLDT